jgi:U3 small nucleolar RNA-associated protein 3
MDDEDEEVPVSALKSKRVKNSKNKAPEIDEDERSNEEDDEESWGKRKSAYYSSNAAELESDDEEVNEMEEAEALRLQSKARRALTDDDFGLGDVQEYAVSEATRMDAEEYVPVEPSMSI